ncbi:MAG: YebC/PmpR family DNA-binding transcriptional regulator [Bacteroidota bacterium]
MAGHNKWSKIKRKKGVADARRSKVWARITRDVMVAAREGGGDVAMNPKLALSVDKAKAENMPKDNVERAIKRGTGEIEGAEYEEVTYEGYGPGGVAIFVETLTDNTNRTVADVRHAFSKAGGSLGKSGSVAYLFERKGVIEVPSDGQDELTLFELVAEAGADDMVDVDGAFVITTPVEAFDAVQTALETAGVDVREASLMRTPTTTVTLDETDTRKVMNLVERLEDLQDVQAVYTALEVEGEAFAAVS